MMRHEFENHVKEFAAKNDMSGKADMQLQKMSTADYQIVELVYTYHPAIPNVRGKERIAALFTLGGMIVMYDMLPRAEVARDLITERDRLAAKIHSIGNQYEMLKRGSVDGSPLYEV